MSEFEARARYQLEVSGVSCGSCVAHVDEALRAVQGVRSARVHLETASGAAKSGDAA